MTCSHLRVFICESQYFEFEKLIIADADSEPIGFLSYLQKLVS